MRGRVGPYGVLPAFVRPLGSGRRGILMVKLTTKGGCKGTKELLRFPGSSRQRVMNRGPSFGIEKRGFFHGERSVAGIYENNVVGYVDRRKS